DVDASSMRRHHQRRDLVERVLIDVGTLPDQVLHHREIATPRPLQQWRLALTVARIDRGALLHHLARARRILLLGEFEQPYIELLLGHFLCLRARDEERGYAREYAATQYR